MGQPPDDHHEILVANTFIGAETPTVEVTFQDFARVAPPLPQASAVLEVNIEPDSLTFYESVDPGASSRHDNEDDTDNIVNVDHNARLADADDDGDPNADPCKKCKAYPVY